MTPGNSDEQIDVEQTLRMLKPQSAQLDVSSVFYQAGYQAAIANQSNQEGSGFGRVLVSVLLAAAIVAPISFQAGASRSEKTVPIKPDVQEVAESTAPLHENVAVGEIEIEEEVAEQPDRVKQSRLVDLLVGQWFGGADSGRSSLATTLTASHAKSLTRSDVEDAWPDFSLGIENRYQTYAVDLASSDEDKTLAISDTVGLAESLGGF